MQRSIQSLDGCTMLPAKLTVSFLTMSSFPWNCSPSHVRHEVSVCMELHKDKMTIRILIRTQSSKATSLFLLSVVIGVPITYIY